MLPSFSTLGISFLEYFVPPRQTVPSWVAGREWRERSIGCVERALGQVEFLALVRVTYLCQQQPRGVAAS